MPLITGVRPHPPWTSYDGRGDRLTTSTLTVLFDGGCPLCRRTVRLLRGLDWLHRLQFVDATDADARARVAPGLSEADVMVEMYVVGERGARYGGFEGYLQIARVVPIMWPFVLGGLPGLRTLGRILYSRIAASRVRRGRCTDDLCAPLPPRRA
jgi:predicted DCC family thiol-disulfide oxidoreductase YuxK